MKKHLIAILLLSLLLTGTVYAVGSGSGAGVLPNDDINVSDETIGEVPVFYEDVYQNTSDAGMPGDSLSERPDEMDGGLCNDIEDRKERITCRLQKDPSELAKELELAYMPEECRPIEDSAMQDTCVQRYKDLKPCWPKAPGADRIACVKDVLGIDRLVSPADYCAEMDGEMNSDQQLCEAKYKEKVYHLITFRFYDGEERVEEWHKDGFLSLEQAVDFIDLVADSKIMFNAAGSMEERMDVIRKVSRAWDEVVRMVRPKLSK